MPIVSSTIQFQTGKYDNATRHTCETCNIKRFPAFLSGSISRGETTNLVITIKRGRAFLILFFYDIECVMGSESGRFPSFPFFKFQFRYERIKK